MKHLIAGLIALWVFLGATEHAHALPIGIAIAGAIGLGGLGIGTTIAGALIIGAIGVGLQLVAGALMRKRGASDVGGTTGRMQTGGVVPRAFPFGAKAVVTHSLTYWNSFGQDGKTPNAYLVMEFSLSDLPIGGGRAALQEFWPNGTKATWNPAATPDTYGIAIPEFNKDGRDHMWVEVFDGTQTTADSLLVSQFSADPNWPYASTRVGFGVVKVRVICRLNRDLFSGFPTFKFVCKGVPFYDVREDTSAGGSGSQDFDDDSTWESGVENPIAVAYNLIRGVSYEGTWFFGGQTASASQLPFSAFNAAMNECDATITNEDSSTEKQFRCAGEIRLDMEPGDVIDDLLRACNGKIGEIGGVYKPHVGPASVAVLSITDDDIRTDEDQTYEPFFGLQDIVNSINAKYVEPGEGWVAKDAPALIDEDLEAIDGGRRQPVDLQYEYVPFSRQVQRQNRATLSDYRRERRHALPLAPEAWRLEPAIDFVSWTSERNGYTAKLFSVEAVTDMDGFLVGVMLKEVDPGDYDNVTSIAPDINIPPIVFPPSQTIEDFAVEPITLDAYSAVPRPGIRLSWDGDDIDDVIGVQYEVRRYETTDVVFEGQSPESTVAVGRHDISANLAADTSYQVRARFVPGSGRSTTWSRWLPIVTNKINVNYLALDEDLRRRIDDVFGDHAASVWSRIREVEEKLESLGEGTAREVIQSVGLVAGVEGRSRAAIIQEQVVRATEDQALASSITALSSDLDDVIVDLGGLETTVSGHSTAISSLETDVSTIDGELSSQASAITAIESSISDLEGDVLGYGSAITALETDVSTLDGEVSSISSALTAVEAEVGDLNASGVFKVTAVVSPPTGAASGFQMLVKATDSGNFAQAGIKAYAVAGGGGSPQGYVSLVGNRIYREDASGGTPVLMVDSAGRFVGDALGSGIVNTFFEYTRPERAGDDTMGTHNTGPPTYASGAGNGWYVDGTDLVGSITIPANPNVIGAGAPNSTYGAVFTTVNAIARNQGIGWGLGSAAPMVVAFRVRFDDNAGSVYWSEEGRIACSSGYTTSGAAYGFGGNPGTLTDIVPVPAGTYSVYLEYRWGAQTQNGISPTPSAPNGVPVRLSAKIVCLLLKK